MGVGLEARVLLPSPTSPGPQLRPSPVHRAPEEACPPDVAWGDWVRPVSLGVPPAYVSVLADLFCWSPRPATSTTSLKAHVSPLPAVRGSLVTQPKGSVLQHLGAGGERGCCTKPPLSGDQWLSLGPEARAGEAGPRMGSVCEGWVGVVCLCVFSVFFLNMRFFFGHQCWPRAGAAALGAWMMGGNMQRGGGGFVLRRNFFCKSKLNTFFKRQLVDEIEAGALFDIQPKNLTGL